MEGSEQSVKRLVIEKKVLLIPENFRLDYCFYICIQLVGATVF